MANPETGSERLLGIAKQLRDHEAVIRGSTTYQGYGRTISHVDGKLLDCVLRSSIGLQENYGMASVDMRFFEQGVRMKSVGTLTLRVVGLVVEVEVPMSVRSDVYRVAQGLASWIPDILEDRPANPADFVKYGPVKLEPTAVDMIGIDGLINNPGGHSLHAQSGILARFVPLREVEPLKGQPS